MPLQLFLGLFLGGLFAGWGWAQASPFDLIGGPASSGAQRPPAGANRRPVATAAPAEARSIMGGFAQSASAPTVASQPPRGVMQGGIYVSPYGEYRIGPHDVLRIWVYDAPEFSVEVRVSHDGKVRLPLFKDFVSVEKLTTIEAEQALRDAFIEQGLLVDPIVMIEVAEYNAHPVLVTGAVESPIIFQAVGPTTLLEAVTQAGGLAAMAGPMIIIQRPAAEEQPAETLYINSQDFLLGLHGAQEVPIFGGERIRVPQAPTAFAIGAGSAGGAIPILDETGMEFFEFMAKAGVRPSNTHRKAIILRSRPNSEFEKDKIVINLEKAVKFEVQTTAVLPNDIVYFPESDARLSQGTIIERVANQALNVAIWRGMWYLFR